VWAERWGWVVEAEGGKGRGPLKKSMRKGPISPVISSRPPSLQLDSSSSSKSIGRIIIFTIYETKVLRSDYDLSRFRHHDMNYA
jgi:hypothetical protein